MKILNFGSLNIDHVFSVEQIVQPGQTIDSLAVSTYPGGKGLNQTLALARAGAQVAHAGLIGEDGQWLVELLEKDHVDCRFIKIVSTNTGSAFIQVDAKGQNSIVLSGGANRKNDRAFCEEVLRNFEAGDLLLLQNEISCIEVLIDIAYQKKMMIALNPSPMNAGVLDCDLKKLSLFIMNEDEGMQITGQSREEDIMSVMGERFPEAQVILTLGAKGSLYQYKDKLVRQSAYRVKAVDTTAAGDTFTGYFLAALAQGRDISHCLSLASKASAMAVMKEGAASSIPYLAQVESAELMIDD